MTHITVAPVGGLVDRGEMSILKLTYRLHTYQGELYLAGPAEVLPEAAAWLNEQLNHLHGNLRAEMEHPGLRPLIRRMTGPLHRRATYTGKWWLCQDPPVVLAFSREIVEEALDIPPGTFVD